MLKGNTEWNVTQTSDELIKFGAAHISLCYHEQNLLLELQIVKDDTELTHRLKEFTAEKLSEPYSYFDFRDFSTLYSNVSILVFDITKEVTDMKLCYCGQRIINDASLEGDLIGLALNSLIGGLDIEPDLHFQTNEKNSSEICGYIAMLLVTEKYRRKHLGALLIQVSNSLMKFYGAKMVTLETEVSNVAAVSLYERLGYVRVKRMTNYYFNGSDGFVFQKML